MYWLVGDIGGISCVPDIGVIFVGFIGRIYGCYFGCFIVGICYGIIFVIGYEPIFGIGYKPIFGMVSIGYG